MTEMVKKIQNIQLPPHQLRELGLEKDWNKTVTPSFIGRVVRVAEKYRGVIQELAQK